MSDNNATHETWDVPIIVLPIAASADQVWQALRDRDLILQWFGWDAQTLPAEIELIFFDHAVADDDARTLRFEGMSDRFEVEARGQQSILRIVRAGPSPDTDWDLGFEDMTQGWMAFAQQLKFGLEHHSLQGRRRTLYLNGSPAEGDPLGAGALGLDDLPLVGQQFNEIVGPEEDGLTGHVWHKSRHQFGVSVDQWGDGLLIVMDRPPNDRWPTGGSHATLTTYGMDEAEFEALEARWREWWDEHFQAAAQVACD